MTIQDFNKSLGAAAPPSGLNLYLQSLWYDAGGNWKKAHDLIQDVGDTQAAWIHAYLHRKEGDNSNAAYWYKAAGRQMPKYSLEDEWVVIVEALLG